MDLHVEAFWLAKNGSSEAEYEDAFGPRINSPRRLKGTRFRFAVADGATEASFSKQWATQLVRAFVADRLGIPIAPDELKPLQERWRKAVHWRPLPWYAEELATRGAFSSLLGLELATEPSNSGESRAWRATAVGDSCLVQIRKNEVKTAWPLNAAAAFNNSPRLLSSISDHDFADRAFMQKTEGEFWVEDTFFLMTDALACWFLRECEQAREPWQHLRDLGTQDQPSFLQFIHGLRASGAIKNDDVTLLRIDIFG